MVVHLVVVVVAAAAVVVAAAVVAVDDDVAAAAVDDDDQTALTYSCSLRMMESSKPPCSYRNRKVRYRNQEFQI